MVSALFGATACDPVEGFDFTDITYHRAVDVGAVRIAFDRPEVRNAFRPHTVDELYRALDHARQHIMEVHRLIRFMPKVVICLVPGWAAGGGHSLHVVCDLTLASREHARFRQTDADVASFDGGLVGQQVCGGEAPRLAYGTDEAAEGRDAFLERRTPDWSPYPWHF